MPNKEKVIKGLECHTKKKVCMNHCPYCDGTGCTEMCTSTLINDALILLKEQEPRLITNEDFANADRWYNILAWCENNPSLGVKTIDSWCIIYPDKLNDKFARYWTSKPTDEQKQATKWE